MNFVFVLSCLGLLAAAAAQYPKPCVSPPLMTGGVSLMASGNISLVGTITYDSYGQKVRVRSFGLAANGSFALDHLMLFYEEVYYEINWQTFSCRKKQLDSGFTPMRVHPDAIPGGQVIMGTSSAAGMGVLINNWRGSLPGNGTYWSVFTEIGCIPMTFSGFGSGNEWTIASTYNWVVGITNPADLHPPSFCAKAQLEKSEKPDTFFSALASLAEQTASSG